MSNIKISINQINTKVGSINSNTNKIVEKIKEATKNNCDIVCFPELTITGYPPEDLVLSETFIKNNLNALDKIINSTNNITAIVGYIDSENNEIFNSAAIISNKKLKVFLQSSFQVFFLDLDLFYFSHIHLYSYMILYLINT